MVIIKFQVVSYKTKVIKKIKKNKNNNNNDYKCSNAPSNGDNNYVPIESVKADTPGKLQKRLSQSELSA